MEQWVKPVFVIPTSQIRETVIPLTQLADVPEKAVAYGAVLGALPPAAPGFGMGQHRLVQGFGEFIPVTWPFQ